MNFNIRIAEIKAIRDKRKLQHCNVSGLERAAFLLRQKQFKAERRAAKKVVSP